MLSQSNLTIETKMFMRFFGYVFATIFEKKMEAKMNISFPMYGWASDALELEGDNKREEREDSSR